ICLHTNQIIRRRGGIHLPHFACELRRDPKSTHRDQVVSVWRVTSALDIANVLASYADAPHSHEFVKPWNRDTCGAKLSQKPRTDSSERHRNELVVLDVRETQRGHLAEIRR